MIILAVTTQLCVSQTTERPNNMKTSDTYPKALVDFNDFKYLVETIEKHREERLIDLNTFLAMSKKDNIVILDSRSDYRFERKHLKGAIHLDFTDYTHENLRRLIPDTNTTILIYCNNNFAGDQVDFASKMARPTINRETQILSNRKPVMLALNIPTYINLYGYGYHNIYELNELVSVNDKRIEFEGSVVK
jgi:hypothetical protein